MKNIYSFLKIIFRYCFWGISLLFRTFTIVNEKRILCNSYSYTKYSCNPKYITEYLINAHAGEYEIYWCFKKGIAIPQLPKDVKVVVWRSLKYFYLINTSKFIFSNTRLGKFSVYLLKRKKQKYIMTWHSSMGIKKIEKDAEKWLSKDYVKSAKYDSSICDLILSGCRFRTNIIRKSFWYQGEILEKGTPRNDILFVSRNTFKDKICKKYNLNHDVKILLYAPTFRSDYNLNCYKFDWQDALSVLWQKYNEKYCVLLRLHPNFLNRPLFDLTKYLNNSIVDVTDYHDMQELLCISDILVTDYSSSLFDFALLYRPCFIYSTDFANYDRGTYLGLQNLPFSLAMTNEELLYNLHNFDMKKYRREVIRFNSEIIGTYEEGVACESLYKWMGNV